MEMFDSLLAVREGWGKDAVGGAGAPVYYVTSLADDGSPGTFRHAWESPDPCWIRFDGLEGTILFGSRCDSGGGNKTIDGRNSNVLFAQSTSQVLGYMGVIGVMHSDIIIAHVAFDGQDEGWDIDGEGGDLIRLTYANDVFIYRCSFIRPFDGCIDAPKWSRRVSIVQCYMEKALQAVNITAHEVSFLRNVGVDVRRRFPQIINGRIHVANCAVDDWDNAAVYNAKTDPKEDNDDFAELFSERCFFQPDGFNQVGEQSEGGKCEVTGPMTYGGGINLTSDGTANATFKADSRAKTVVVNPVSTTERLDLLCRIDQEAGPETTDLRAPRMVLSSRGTGSQITLPAGIQAGDFCVIWNAAEDANKPGISTVTPAGFTQVVSDATGGGSKIQLRGSLYAKILDGTETVVTGLVANETWWAVAVFRANCPFNTLAINDAEFDASGGNPDSITCNAGNAVSRPVIAVGMLACSKSISGASANPGDRLGRIDTGTTQMNAHYGINGRFLKATNYTFDCGDAGGDHRQFVGAAYFTFT